MRSSVGQERENSMPLKKVEQPATLIDEREGVRFTMIGAGRTVHVFVSRHALEYIAWSEHGNGHVERFNEYRCQFEQIASEKYDDGLIERDGTICIRGRDLPGKGY
jgi:hypothetical protein